MNESEMVTWTTLPIAPNLWPSLGLIVAATMAAALAPAAARARSSSGGCEPAVSVRGDSEFYWIFEAVYKDSEKMMASLTSPEGMAAAMDARNSPFGKLMVSFFAEDVA